MEMKLGNTIADVLENPITIDIVKPPNFFIIQGTQVFHILE
jgi:hypothetical protein